ncbi:MAG: tRNA (adenosine(37)-N6)-threonylcarbamoyltransferase complex dimerization subunit type 1 TsaB [Treponema sp.]|jgi:tRNA threonylcarbamoyladenosine biosynthesis protein TsaB|nr:tRNA (adenosine(37)-N6)-threonylcarbamoyltransferase complex dimerization subunit type 1 TsaB [Treponema sp.]
MNCLAIDSCSSVLSVAVSRNDDIFYAHAEEGMKHSELVMDLIDSKMKEAALKPMNLNGVFCMGGPGSFTGLRIGYSIAKALCLSLSIPFAPVPSLDCIARKEQGNEKKTLAVIQARRNAYFYAFFRGALRLTSDVEAEVNQIADEINQFKEEMVLSGPGCEQLYKTLPDELKENILLRNINSGYAREIIAVAKNRKILDNGTKDFLYSGPEYIRKTDAEISQDLK